MPHIEAFYGALTQSSARIYAQCPDLPGGGEWSLGGSVKGPVCEGVRTLPATAELVDLGEGATLLARATMLDPSLWSPDLPARYELEIELLRDGQLVETFQRTIGLRQLGGDGRDLRWQGRRWVMRGVTRDEAGAAELDFCRAERTTLVIARPTDELLRAASLTGVLLAVEVQSPELPATVRHLARWPAVGMIIAPNAAEMFQDVDAAALNLLRAARINPAGTSSLAAWADVVFGDASQPARLAEFAADCDLPVVAERKLRRTSSLQAARAACDYLQRDLAPLGEFAGYVV